MTEKHMPEKRDDQAKERRPEVELYDPFRQHFVSQNSKNDFLKALETSTAH